MDQDQGRAPGLSKVVISLLQVQPKGQPPRMPHVSEMFLRHPKGKDMDRKGRLAVAEGGIRNGIDLFNIGIRHPIAAGGDTVAMDHQCRTGAAIGQVIGIRIAEVKLVFRTSCIGFELR
jgi:hypothetical protein